MAVIISGRRMTNTGAEMSKGSGIYILHILYSVWVLGVLSLKSE